MNAREYVDMVIDMYSVTDDSDGPQTKKDWLAIDALLADAVNLIKATEWIHRAKALGYSPEDKSETN